MAINWGALGRELGNIVVQQGPKIIGQIQKTVAGPTNAPQGRPVTSIARPTADRARRLAYSPSLDGKADPGEVVWTWVVFEEDASQGKDRPVLVVGRDRAKLLGLMLSSNPRREADPNWMYLGEGEWDAERRPSWIRLDRVLDVPEAGIRREGAVLGKSAFDQVAERLVRDFGWR
jgi:hypothetical protein